MQNSQSTPRLVIAIGILLGLGVGAGVFMRSTGQAPKELVKDPRPAEAGDAREEPVQAEDRSSSDPILPSTELRERLDNALQKIARLERENRSLRKSMIRKNGTGEILESAEDRYSDADAVIPNAPETAAILEQIETRFDLESLDPGWADGVEQSLLSQFFERERTGNELIDARCRSTLCRVEIDHLDAEAESRFWANVSDIEGLAPEQVHIHRVTNPDGLIKTVLYVARAGHRIHGVDNPL